MCTGEVGAGLLPRATCVLNCSCVGGTRPPLDELQLALPCARVHSQMQSLPEYIARCSPLQSDVCSDRNAMGTLRICSWCSTASRVHLISVPCSRLAFQDRGEMPTGKAATLHDKGPANG